MPSSQMKAFLSMIGFSEGTTTASDTKNDGYDVIVHGIPSMNFPRTFTDYSKHPGILVTLNNRGLVSTAAGRYQILYRFWKVYKVQLKLKGFYPEDQDAIAIQLIKECKATADVEAGRIADAVRKCNSRWASFTGSPHGQPTHPIKDLEAAFVRAGGKLA